MSEWRHGEWKWPNLLKIVLVNDVLEGKNNYSRPWRHFLNVNGNNYCLTPSFKFISCKCCLSNNCPSENCLPRKVPPGKLPPENCPLWKLPPMKIPTYKSFPLSNFPPPKIALLKTAPKKINPRKLKLRKLSPMKIVTIVVKNWKFYIPSICNQEK